MNTNEETIKCPNCAESIKKEAVTCRYCGYDLKSGKSKSLGENQSREVKAKSGVWDGVKIGCGMFIILPLLLLGGFLFVMFIIASILSGGR